MRFEHVSFTYPGATEPAVSDVSFELRPGSSLALVGENGSGKTTLIKLLTRLYTPSAGRITLDGLDLVEWDPATLRARIGVIFQDFARYQLKVGENIGAGDVAQFENEARWRAAAELGMAAPFIDELPGGYETQLGKWFKEGRELSGGQWQKIALSRAFMRESADILVLDEPTAAMDARAEAQVFEQFQALAHDRMVDPDFASLFDGPHGAPDPRDPGRPRPRAGQPRCAHAARRTLRAIVRAAGSRLPLSSRNLLCGPDRSCGRLDVQRVSRSRLRAQVLRRGGVLFYLLPQSVHQLLQQLPVATASMTPDVRQQPLGADDVSRIRHQDLQQPRLELRELDRRRIADDAANAPRGRGSASRPSWPRPLRGRRDAAAPARGPAACAD